MGSEMCIRDRPELLRKDSTKSNLDRFCQMVETPESSQDVALWTESLLAGDYGMLPELTRTNSAKQENHDLLLGRDEDVSEGTLFTPFGKQPGSASRIERDSSQGDWNYSQPPRPVSIQPRSMPSVQQRYRHDNSSGGNGIPLFLLPPAGVQGPRKPLRLPPPGISSVRRGHRHPRAVRKKARFQREVETEYAQSFDAEQTPMNKVDLPSSSSEMGEHTMFTFNGDVVDMQFLDSMDWGDVGNDLSNTMAVPLPASLDEDDEVDSEATDLLIEDGT